MPPLKESIKGCGSTRSACAFVLLMAVAVLASPDGAARGEDEMQQELQTDRYEEGEEEDENSGKVDLGLEADLESAYERQGGSETSEITFDEVGVTLDGPWWQVVAGVKYESEKKKIRVEEAVARIGGTEDLPWYLQIGRTVLPFGEFDTQFIEDQLVTVIGEADEDAVVFGFENDALEACIGIYRGESGARDDVNGVISAKALAWRDVAFGIALSNDLGESVELQEINLELSHENNPDAAARRNVAGFTGFVSVDFKPLHITLEYLTALESFDVDFLGEDSQTPSAWNAEIGVRPLDGWEIASRVESAHDLPENPKWQYGASTSYELTESICFAVEYLYGDFGSEDDDRHLVSSALTIEY